MKGLIYLRALKVEDALVSYKWRNNPIIWRYTESRRNKIITHEMETEWIKTVLKRKNEKRFAICVSENDNYIGNVQLTNIDAAKAEFHIFIGDTDYWGRGIGKEATRKMVDIGFNKLNLKAIYLKVDKRNISAIRSYQSVGFINYKAEGDQIYMIINSNG